MGPVLVQVSIGGLDGNQIPRYRCPGSPLSRRVADPCPFLGQYRPQALRRLEAL